MNIEERPKSNNTWVMRLMAFLLFETRREAELAAAIKVK
jgi:hypothetical protein